MRGGLVAGAAVARDLRRRMTAAEERLWAAIRGRRLDGLKFRRQHQVGPYILDFYCAECRLAIELDGAIHDARRDYDAERTAHLAAYGYRVLRFRNEDVLGRLPDVLDQIAQTARAGRPHPPTPSPELGRVGAARQRGGGEGGSSPPSELGRGGAGAREE